MLAVATNAAEDADWLVKLMKAGAAAAEAFRITSGGYYKWLGQTRVSTQFDKTNTTLANITGLSVNVQAGKTYYFEARLFFDADVVGGHILLCGPSDLKLALHPRHFLSSLMGLLSILYVNGSIKLFNRNDQRFHRFK